MTHLILCREYPPAPYPAGGIGAYARHITRMLAEAGETVHLIAQRWEGARERLSHHCGGKLIVHRIALDEALVADPLAAKAERDLLKQLASSTCPSQLFSWQAARYAERLIGSEDIDLIEAQEWEAPLYYLQVRRALGLGPERQPPCLVHLHSPSQMIFQHNEWDTTLTDYLPLCRFEEYSIRAADALLCPSTYLAQQIGDLFDLEPGRAQVIPYPSGEIKSIDRSPPVWAHDAVCYVGRLELRKGVIEWVDAAVQVAGSHPTVSFDFVGSDTTVEGGIGHSVLEALKRRIPRSLLSRFRFHGSRTHGELLELLTHVSFTVIPSRWENFPFTCIEAMATGLPVLASPCGGMAELIVDGESGWLADSGSPSDLATALWRALRSTPAERQAMGANAAERVRRICGNDVVLSQQIAFREHVLRQGVIRSTLIPTSQTTARTINPQRAGIGVVLTCLETSTGLGRALDGIAQQSLPAPTSLIVRERLRGTVARVLGEMDKVGAPLSVTYVNEAELASARRLGIDSLLSHFPDLRAIAFLDVEARLEPNYVAVCEAAFARQPQVGLVAPWILHDGRHKDLDAGPCRVLPSAPGEAEPPPGSAIHVEVLQQLGPSQAAAPEDLARALVSGGWSAVTFPGPLLRLRSGSQGGAVSQPLTRRYSGMALIQAGSPQLALQWFLAAPWHERCRWIARVVSNPQRAARWLVWTALRRFTTLRTQPTS